MSIGARIKKRREEIEMSQEQLAKMLGYKSRSSINKIEKDGRELPQSKIKAIADALKVPPAYIMGWEPKEEQSLPSNCYSLDGVPRIPVIGTVRAGYDSIAYEEILGYEFAIGVSNPGEHIYLRVKGDSMSPKICDNDLVLVHKQPDVDSGDIAVVIYNGEDGTIKKLIKKDKTVFLQPLNPEYDTRILSGEELNDVYIVGKVLSILRKI